MYVVRDHTEMCVGTGQPCCSTNHPIPTERAGALPQACQNGAYPKAHVQSICSCAALMLHLDSGLTADVCICMRTHAKLLADRPLYLSAACARRAAPAGLYDPCPVQPSPVDSTSDMARLNPMWQGRAPSELTIECESPILAHAGQAPGDMFQYAE